MPESRSRVSDGYQKKVEALEQKLQRKKRGAFRTFGRAHAFKKRTWGDLTALWVAHDIRDAIMDFIAHWSERTEIGALHLVGWIGLSRSKFYSWRDRYGKANEHNALVPRDHWLFACPVALGIAHRHDGARRRDRLAASSRKIP